MHKSNREREEKEREREKRNEKFYAILNAYALK